MGEILIDVAESGAGTNGPLEVGAWSALWDHGYRPKRLDCTSAGSIVGALLALGRTPDDMRHIILDANYDKLIDYSAFSPLIRDALTNPSNVHAWLREITEDQLMADVLVPLSTTSSNLVTQKPTYWRSWEVPQMPVWQAVYASMAIPFIFPPYLKEYVDGGVLDNLPVSSLPKDGKRLALMVTNHAPKDAPHSIVGEALRLISMMLSANEEQACKLASDIDVPVVKLDARNMGFLDRTQTKDEKLQLYDWGREAMEAWLASDAGKSWSLT